MLYQCSRCRKGVQKLIPIDNADAEKLQAWVRREFNCCEITISEFSAAMGYATGPGVLGIAFCPEFDIAEQKR